MDGKTSRSTYRDLIGLSPIPLHLKHQQIEAGASLANSSSRYTIGSDRRKRYAFRAHLSLLEQENPEFGWRTMICCSVGIPAKEVRRGENASL